MPLILGTNSIKDTGYDVANSCRFNNGFNAGGDDAYMHRTNSSAGNRRTFTLSAWIKRGAYFNDEHPILAAADTTAIRFSSEGGSNSKINVFYYSGGWVFRVHTNAEYRDPSAWMHLVVAFDTTQVTASNRIKIYVNGNQVTSMGNSDYPSENYETQFNNNVLHSIARNANSNDYYEGYLSEVVMIDGQALDPTSFGEFDEDSGIWKPIDVSGLTFGTNGFYLDFENSGSLGADVSGNGNNFTVNNLTSVDQSTDTCTNNFITWSALTPRSSDITLSQGNCDVTMGGTSRGIFATIGVSSGKWYYESKWVSGSYFQTGVVATDTMNDNDDVYSGKTGAFMYDQAGNIKSGGSTLASVNSLSTGDIVGVALDMDNDLLYFYKNGAVQNSGTGIDISAYSEYTFGCAPTSAVLSGNFGNPTFSISSGNADGNGYGNFEYAVPSGYYALNTKNLAEYG